MKILKTLALIVCIFIQIQAQNNQEQWTWLFTKKFTSQEKIQNSLRPFLLFSKNDTPLFNQLVFSWNSFKPTKGHFTFYAQVRDSKTKQWHNWHKMIDWGKDIQQSYLHKGTVTDYFHVRLEVPKSQLADGLRIKVLPNNDAQLSFLEALAVNVSNLTQFKPTLPDHYEHLPSLKISGIPQHSQMVLDHPRFEHLCSPTSCSMLVSYLNNSPINPVEFAYNVYDKGLDSFGSWPFNTAHAFEHCNGNIFFHIARLHSFADIYTKLKQNIPVVVSVRGPLKGAPREYKNGHLILITGWNQQLKKVMCHDPASVSNNEVAIMYDIDSFCHAWARSHHLAYIAEVVR